MELIRARRVTVQICILCKPENSGILLSANDGFVGRRRVIHYTCTELYEGRYFSAEIPGFRKTMVSSQDEGLFITQSSTNADISGEIEGNVV